jgi:aspartyl-tRNA(Asn)/glutamyl-tRNA(Gln) amidotransferase subunit A
MPALGVCSGFDADGLPIGVQIAARPLDDALVLRIGAAYEAATPWRERRPPLAE